MFYWEDIRQRMIGNWEAALLSIVNIDRKVFNGKHQPCPHCMGKDRFRWDNNFETKGDGGASSVGSFISSPGGKAGLPAGPANPPFQPVANTNSDGPTGWNIVGSSGAGAEPAVAVANSYAAGSRGSNSIFGVGGSVPALNSPANPGGGYGSGASGCSNGPSQSAKSGAAGRPGIVIIEELA